MYIEECFIALWAKTHLTHMELGLSKFINKGTYFQPEKSDPLCPTSPYILYDHELITHTTIDLLKPHRNMQVTQVIPAYAVYIAYITGLTKMHIKITMTYQNKS